MSHRPTELRVMYRDRIERIRQVGSSDEDELAMSEPRQQADKARTTFGYFGHAVHGHSRRVVSHTARTTCGVTTICVSGLTPNSWCQRRRVCEAEVR